MTQWSSQFVYRSNAELFLPTVFVIPAIAIHYSEILSITVFSTYVETFNQIIILFCICIMYYQIYHIIHYTIYIMFIHIEKSMKYTHYTSIIL